LNAKGEEAAKAQGEAFKLVGAPVGKVITSQFNRAYQTAKLAGFDNVEKNTDVTEGGWVVSPNENNRAPPHSASSRARFPRLAPMSSSSRTSPTS